MLLAQSPYVVRPALGLMLVALGGLTQAQEPANDAPPMKSEFKVDYRSPIRSYQVFSEPTPASWKESNDLVGRIGGWRAYARESRDGASTKPGAGPGPERDDPHAGHREKGR